MTEVDRDRRIWEIRRAQKEGSYMRGPQGYTAQWEAGTGARLRPWTQSNIHEGRLQNPEGELAHQFSIPTLRKRTFQERLESMTKRLIDTPEAQQGALLQQIAGDFWKAGMPITTHALQQAAARILNRADVRIALSNRTSRGGK